MTRQEFDRESGEHYRPASRARRADSLSVAGGLRLHIVTRHASGIASVTKLVVNAGAGGNLLTEAGDSLLTEAGDNLVLEQN